MKFITSLTKQMPLAFVVGMLFSLSSCGSFQYSGIYDDGIYSDSDPVEEVTETSVNTSNSSDYYKNYFREKSLQIEEDNTVFTDVDTYEGAYEDDSENTNNYAGWGENNSSEIIINVYDNGPYWRNNWGNNWGYNWGYNWGNNWGWNFGWNNWGFMWQPNYFNSWNNPYCYYGCYSNYGYYNNGYNNYGYNRYRGRSYSYVNGQRRSRYRNSSLSSRSVLSTATRSRVTGSDSRSTTRPSRSTTRSTTTRPARTNSSVRSSNPNTRPNTTTRPTRTSTYSRPSSTRPTRSTARPTTRPTTRSSSTTSSSRSSRSSSGGSSTRRRNN